MNFATATNYALIPQICTDEKGNIYATWMEDLNGYSDIYFNYSTDYGITWQNPDIRLDTDTDDNGDPVSPAESRRPQIGCDENSNVYIMWEDFRYGNVDYWDISFRHANIDKNKELNLQNKDIRVNESTAVLGNYNTSVRMSNNGPYIIWGDSRNKSKDWYYDIYFNGLCCIPIIRDFLLFDNDTNDSNFTNDFTAVGVNLTAYDPDDSINGIKRWHLTEIETFIPIVENDFDYTTKPIVFPFANNLDGLKTVYLWVMDYDGNISLPMMANITLETIKPIFNFPVPLDTNTIQVSFSEEVQRAENINSYLIKKDGDTAIINIDSLVTKGSNTFNLIISEDLTPGSKYTVEIFNINDLAGNIPDITIRAFTVDDDVKPMLINAIATDKNTVEIIFDESVNFNNAAIIFDSGLEYSDRNIKLDDKTYRLSTTDQTEKQIYKITVDNITDVFGNGINSDYNKAAFGGYDGTPPKVLTISPLPNSSNVPIDLNISIEFSEEIDQTSFSFSVSTDGNDIGGSRTWNGNTFTFDPNLSYEKNYTVTIDTVKDLSGNNLESVYMANFSTMPLPDTPAGPATNNGSDDDSGGGICFINTAED